MEMGFFKLESRKDINYNAKNKKSMQSNHLLTYLLFTSLFSSTPGTLDTLSTL